MRWLVLVGLVACYTPRGSQCEPCSGVEVCPGGLACIAGTCRASASECDSAIDARACFGSLQPPFIEICPMIDLPPERSLPPMLDTNVDCTFTEVGICVIAAARILVNGKTRVVGQQPLALLGRTEVVVATNAVLDVAGHAADSATTVPAAANLNICAGAHGANNGADQLGGGGAGGSFASTGGAGGAGSSGGNTAAGPLTSTFPMLRGGCRGGDGGTAGSPQLAGGLGGNSGGAVYVLSPSVVVEGTINASGGGGRGGGGAGTGGGGGGSGGMILIWALSFRIGDEAKIFALGGGGAPGAVTAGKAGDDPDGPLVPATVTAPDAGGAGNGAAGGSNGDNQGGSGGAGGGGGGFGRIEIRPALKPPLPMNIVPPPV